MPSSKGSIELYFIAWNYGTQRKQVEEELIHQSFRNKFWLFSVYFCIYFCLSLYVYLSLFWYQFVFPFFCSSVLVLLNAAVDLILAPGGQNVSFGILQLSIHIMHFLMSINICVLSYFSSFSSDSILYISREQFPIVQHYMMP